MKRMKSNPVKTVLITSGFLFLLSLHGCGWLLPAFTLHEAARRGDTEKVLRFIDKGADVNGESVGVRPLTIALNGCHTETAKKLIEQGADVNFVDRVYKTSPIVQAAICRNFELTKLLIEKGADVNAATGLSTTAKEGFTALMEAAYHGDTAIGRILLEHGANPEAQSAKGTTPLINARATGHHSFEDMLNAYIRAERSSFSLAMGSGDMALNQIYLDKYAYRSDASFIKQRLDYLPLINACLKLNRPEMGSLLASGMSLSGKPEASKRLLQLLLIQTFEKKNSLNSMDSLAMKKEENKGISKVNHVCDILVFKMLLEAGTDPDIFRLSPLVSDKIIPAIGPGMTALEYAEQNNLTDFRNLLRDRLSTSKPDSVIQKLPDKIIEYQRVGEERYIEIYEDYLKYFPKGQYYAEVRSQLEQFCFYKATDARTPKAIQAYLDKYPQGKYAVLARQRMEYLPLMNACLALDFNSFDSLMKSGKRLTGYAEPARMLLQLLQKQTMRTLVISNFQVTGTRGPSEIDQKYDLNVFRLLLAAGADPDVYHIKSFEKAGITDLDKEGNFQLYSTGTGILSEIVPAGEGGMSALEFATENELTGFRELLLKVKDKK